MKKKYEKPQIEEINIEDDILINSDFLLEDIQVFAVDERGGGGGY